MTDFPTLEAFQGFIYAAITVTSLGVMGITAEGCDIAQTCPSRNVAVIVFAVFVFLLALPMFAAYAFELSFLKRIEIFLVLGILLFNIIETGVASSPRTPGASSFVPELSWWGLLLTLAAFFLGLSSGDRPKFEVPAKRDDAEATAQPPAPGYTPSTPPSQPPQQTYTSQTPQPGAVNYTTPPAGTK